MEDRVITRERLAVFFEHLIREEKSRLTQEKYMRDLRAFKAFAGGRTIEKELVIAYKKSCMDAGYAVRSVNSMLASINSFLVFMGWHECRVKNIRYQHQAYCAEEKELTRQEYLRLLEASEKNKQFHLVLQTICGTGIRVSELQYFTVEAVNQGEVAVRCKNKTRIVLLPGKLRKLLQSYIREQKIETGPVFRCKNGKPLDRSMIWRKMKELCGRAGVKPSKVFPHNLRKLFARAFYSLEKDIAKLADVLGHSNINTTRIYIMTTGAEHRRQIERLGLIL